MDLMFWLMAGCIGFALLLFALFAMAQTITYAYLFARKRFLESQQRGEEDGDQP